MTPDTPPDGTPTPPARTHLTSAPTPPDGTRLTADTPPRPVTEVHDGSPAAPPAAGVGEVGRYRLLELLAEGGMGAVYRAADVTLDREVAVKLVKDRFGAGSPTARRFLDESRITGRLQHPGIPPVHEVGTLPDGRPFLAMKLIRGRTLADLLAARGGEPHGSSGRGRFVAVFEQICQAVGYAHSRGVIHRDLKPANVMVGAFGEVQVMDWGLAKALTADRDDPPPSRGVDPHVPPATTPTSGPTPPGNSTLPDDPAAPGGTPSTLPGDPAPPPPEPAARRAAVRTATGAVMGTPGYMAPEQARGEGADARADVFGLGAILCVVLTGKPAVAGGDVMTTLRLTAAGDLSDAHARLAGSGAEPELVDLCRRCLAPAAGDRPADAGAVAAAVAAFRAAAEERAKRAEVERERAAVRAAEERKRRRVLVWSAAAVAGVFAAGAGVSAWQAVRANAEADVARTARAKAEAEEQKAKDSKAEAEERQKQEEKARKEEQLARETAEAVAAFMQEVFALGSAKGQASRALGAKPKPTVEEAMDHAAEAIGGRFRDRPGIEAAVRSAIGNTYRELGSFPKALPHLERALAVRRAALGDTHPDTLRSVTGLGLLYRTHGRYADAEPLYKEALAGYRAVRGDTHPDTLGGINNLAVLFWARGDYEAAEPLYKEALAGRRAALGDRDPNTLNTANNLAALYLARGRYADAEPLYKEALAGYRAALGDAHPDTLQAANNLAALYRAQGRYAAAEPLLKEALAGKRAAHGDRHPATLQTANSLGLLYRLWGRYEPAGRLLEEALAGRRAELGETHPDTLESANSLANLYLAQGRHAAAEPLLKGVLEVRRGALNPRHPATLLSVNNLAALYHAQGRHAAAEPLYKEALAGRRATLGAAHPDTLRTLDNLATLYSDTRRYGEAVPLFREALLGAERRPERAAAVPATRSDLGLALLGAGQPAEAEPHLLAGHAGLAKQEQPGPANRNRLRWVTEGLAEVYERTTRPAKAAEWRAKLAALPPEVAPPPRRTAR